MDEKHPKRRRAKENPYTIFKKDGKLQLTFRDGTGIVHNMELSEVLYAQFNQFELDDLVYLNVVDRHYEHSELTELSLNARAFYKEKSVEDIVLCNVQNEAIHRAIKTLPEIQRRRLILYYFSGLTYEQIAKMEGCTITPVKQSIDKAIAKLRKLL